jgi:hypothetical protein
MAQKPATPAPRKAEAAKKPAVKAPAATKPVKKAAGAQTASPGNLDALVNSIRLTNHMVDAPSGGAEFSIP